MLDDVLPLPVAHVTDYRVRSTHFGHGSLQLPLRTHAARGLSDITSFEPTERCHSGNFAAGALFVEMGVTNCASRVASPCYGRISLN
jgi:hypothetical protein